MAIPTTPPWTFGGATTDPSGVEAETPTPSDTGTWTPPRRDRACRCELALLRFLGGSDPGNLALDRREELPARSQLRLDPLLLRGLLRDDRLLLRMGASELLAVTLDRSLEGRDLLDDARVLARSRVDGLDPVEQIVKARCAEQHRERRVVLGGRVGADEPRRERVLRDFQVLTRELQFVRFSLQVVPRSSGGGRSQGCTTRRPCRDCRRSAGSGRGPAVPAPASTRPCPESH